MLLVYVARRRHTLCTLKGLNTPPLVAKRFPIEITIPRCLRRGSSFKVWSVVDNLASGRVVDVLLVEDNPGDARRIDVMLQMIEGSYRLHTANSIRSAHQLLSTVKIEAILLDLSLPDSKGIETVNTLHIAHPWIPIIVLTGMDSEQFIAEAARAGAHDYLVKQDLTYASLWRVLRYAQERRLHEEQLRATQRLYRRQAREFGLLNRIISAAFASNDEQKVLDDICWELAKFYKTERTLILLSNHQDSKTTVRAEHHQNQLRPLLNKQIDLERFKEHTAVSSSIIPVKLQDFPANLKQFLASEANSWIILYPLIISKKTSGYFLLNLRSTTTFSDSDGQLLTTIAQEVGLVLEKIRLNDHLKIYANELEDRVEERTKALAEANEQLKSLDKLKSKFVSDVSHELRNPITNLTLYLELLEFAPKDKQPTYFSTLRSQIRRLSNLVEGILTLSQLEQNEHELLFKQVNLNNLVKNVVAAHTPRAQSKHIDLRFLPENSLPPVHGEPNQLTQIVTNLLDNALSYTLEGTIHITTSLLNSYDRDEIVLTVRDSGIGIPKEDLPYVFDRFYRGSQIDRDAIVGTGLGLGIVSELVSLHNGRIDIQSTLHKGSTFTVTFPVNTAEMHS